LLHAGVELVALCHRWFRITQWKTRCAHCVSRVGNLACCQANCVQGGAVSKSRGAVMLNLYTVKVWHPSAPRYSETINVRTYTIDRAEYLATESYPGCMATARPLVDRPELSTADVRRTAHAH
jgi:hypothetical protein